MTLLKQDLQPINHFVMSETEYKLVNHSVYPDGSADELELCVFGIVEYEMISVEILQSFSPNTTGHLFSFSRYFTLKRGDLPSARDSHMVLSPWCSSFCHIPLSKLVHRMLLPDRIKVKVRPSKIRLQEP